MEITYQILLDRLPIKLTDYSGGKNREIQSVELYSADCGPLSGSTLYIADLETACTLSGGEPLCFFCPRPPRAASGSLVTDNRVAVAETEGRMERLSAVTFNTFMSLNRWIMDMQHSVLEGEGVQALIDLSEELLGNTVTVIDQAFKLLAYSRGHLPQDDVNSYLISNGRYSEETVDKLQRYSRFKDTDESNGITVGRDLFVSRFTTAQKAHRYHGLLSARVVMVCNYREASEGLLDLFRIFNDYIAIYIKRGYPYDGKHSAFDSLVYSLLSGGADSADEAAKKAVRAELDADGFFDLYKIEMLEKPEQSPAYIALNLSRRLPDSRVTMYHGAIIVLNIFDCPDKCAERLDAGIEIIRESTAGSARAAGVSNLFKGITGLRRAYMQAETALGTPGLNAAQSGGFDVRRFEDCYIHHMLLRAGDAGDERIYDNTAAAKAVRCVDAYDRANGTAYVRLMAFWLLHERRATVVGNKLHLHRNTVIYHIAKIEELFGLNFADPVFRIKLLAEIARLRLENHGT